MESKTIMDKQRVEIKSIFTRNAQNISGGATFDRLEQIM